MNEELRAFRVLLIPLALIIIFFFIVPRTCARKPAAEAQTATAETTTASTGGGLHIEGTPDTPPAATSSTYPEGLDAARIRYLVEVDAQFSAPVTSTLPKQWDPTNTVILALQKIQYVEIAADGTVTITRDGLLNLSLSDQGTSWVFPVAKRAFDNVTYVSRVEDDKYIATVAWHFEPNAAGVALNVDAKKAHSSSATFVSGGGTWSLMSWTPAPDSQLRSS